MGNREIKRLNIDDTVFVIIDIQEKLLPAMCRSGEIEETAVKLAKGMKILGVPAVVTQQYTKGLGETAASLREALGEFTPVEKITFSAAGEPKFIEALDRLQRKTVVLCGIESHICVLQTALDLILRGYDVFAVQDCIGSRKDSDDLCSRSRMAAEGVVMTTYESVLYELMKGAKADAFKAISAIVK